MAEVTDKQLRQLHKLAWFRRPVEEFERAIGRMAPARRTSAMVDAIISVVRVERDEHAR